MKNTIILIALLLGIKSSRAQSNWSVNPFDYQYSMTVISEALLDCQASLGINDQLGVFVGSECRGFVNFNTEVNGKQLAYLLVYGSQSSGETLTFKIYDESTNTIIDLLNTMSFLENESVGSSETPYLMSNNTPPSALEIESVELTDLSVMGDVVASFITIDSDGDGYSYSFVNGSNDNASFTIQGSSLLLAEDVDIVAQDTYEIEVEATAANGCNISEVFTLSIQNTNEAPTDVLFANDDNHIKENLVVGSSVGFLNVVDATISDTHTYSFESGGVDNTSFQIQGNELLSSEVFDYEIKDLYFISVRVTDAAGNFIVKELKVQVDDVVELEDLKANNVITPNGDGYNDVFEVPNIGLFENFEFQVYNENGNLVFRRSPSAGYDNLWDGNTTKGVALPSGVYYYVLRDGNNSETVFKGIVNLIRN